MEQISTIKSWLMAARPKTLTASLVPVIVGTALASNQSIDWTLSILALVFSLFIQIGTNLVNDALDFKKGTDTHERIGPVRVTQSGLISGVQVLRAGFLCFALALAVSIPLIDKGGYPILFVVIASIFAGYGYTGGPYPLSYHGFGDLFAFIFYGLIAICAVDYIQTGLWSNGTLLAGLQIGSLTTVIIALNNLRDHKQDKKSNKRTIPVRFGVRIGKFEVFSLVIIPFILSVFWIGEGHFYAGVFPWFVSPIAAYIIKAVSETEPSKEYNHIFALSALLHLSFGMLLALGILVE